jgi:Uma2 family endonuclease
VEVLSPSTRTEDLVGKAQEYAEAGIGQYWVIDPDDDADTLVVFCNAGGTWSELLRLDRDRPTGEIEVGIHGVVSLDLSRILPA